jgi:hypothetical protein
MATVYSEQSATVAVREHPVMRWGAIFAGWFVATGIAGLLYVFGVAVGFSAFDPRNTELAARGASSGAVVWMILTWGAALWIGGMVASWFDGRNDTEMGVVRGLTVWGLAITATGLLLATGITHFTFVTIAVPELNTFNTPTADPAAIAHYTAVTMWTAFGSAALGLVTSVLGGWLGAHHVHHVYHLRTYAAHGSR